MSLFPAIKSVIEHIPEPIGSVLAHASYDLRPGLGSEYRQSRRLIQQSEGLTKRQKEVFAIKRLRPILNHVYQNIPFYRKLYLNNSCNPESVHDLEDFTNAPIINKTALQNVQLEKRSYNSPRRYVVNTGGSSGSPLSFYIQSDFVGREWGHMHTIWAKLGYRQSDLKLAFGGRNLRDKPVAYDALRHHYAVNIYKPFEQIAAALKKLLHKRRIPYLHGYPSAIYDFACYCETHDSSLQDMLASHLKGAFLGSEFPAPLYRDKIEKVFDIPTVSWYGHTERTILAWEKEEKYVYHPFLSYGYAEAVKQPDTGVYHLVGTSYYNFASPFIRYDTEDEIIPVEEEGGILKSFRIEAGRQGEYVIDKSGKRIPLTGLIFGRHHEIFADAKFVQVRQTSEGRATLILSMNKEESLEEKELMDRFDLEGVDMDFDLELVENPIRTQSGKVKLKLEDSGKL